MKKIVRVGLLLTVSSTLFGMLFFRLQYSTDSPIQKSSQDVRLLRAANASPRVVIPALPEGAWIDQVSGVVVTAARPRETIAEDDQLMNVDSSLMADDAVVERSGRIDSVKDAAEDEKELSKEDFEVTNLDSAIPVVPYESLQVGSVDSNVRLPLAASSNIDLAAAVASDSIPANGGVHLIQNTRNDVGVNGNQGRVPEAVKHSMADNFVEGSIHQLPNKDSRDISPVKPVLGNLSATPKPQPSARSNPVSSFKEPCPDSYNITGPDDVWFRSRIIQRSPRRNTSRDGDIEQYPQILILTPISNSVKNLQRYFANLCSLSYPHHLISVVLGEDSSLDDTFRAARKHVEILRPHFASIEVVRLKGMSRSPSDTARHAPFFQHARRGHLAAARNQLLFAGLVWGGVGGRAEWVLWMDSDVKHIPVDIVERLTAVEKRVVVPNCLYRQDNGQTDTFDRNTWRETDASRRKLDTAEANFLMLEGYEPTKRKYLNELKGEGDLVKIDGVGGCILLVDAQLHREGLVFPAFVFDHHIETEGLAKMAARLEIEMYGLPSVNVVHA